MAATNHRTPASWQRIGRQVGHERGQRDRLQHTRQNPADLWIPADTPPIYADSVREGYTAGLKGEPVPGGDL